ncbi:MAG: hypothetical protein V1910_02705 [bacterium]
MIKISTIFILGIFTTLIPFLGFPNDNAFPVKNILCIISGLSITILSILIRKELEEVTKHLYTHNITKIDNIPEKIEKNI